MGEHRYRLDVLENNPDETSPFAKRLKELDEEIEKVSRERAGLDAAFLNPYTPIIHALQQKFDIEELRQLAYDTGINMQHVGGETLPEMCRLLVEYAARRNKLLELMQMAGSETHRPPVEDWIEML